MSAEGLLEAVAEALFQRWTGESLRDVDRGALTLATQQTWQNMASVALAAARAHLESPEVFDAMVADAHKAWIAEIVLGDRLPGTREYEEAGVAAALRAAFTVGFGKGTE